MFGHVKFLSWRRVVSDIAIFVLKRDVKLQLTNFWRRAVVRCEVAEAVFVMMSKLWTASVSAVTTGSCVDDVLSVERTQGRSAHPVSRRVRQHLRQLRHPPQRAGDPRAAGRGHLHEGDVETSGNVVQVWADGAWLHLREQVHGKHTANCRSDWTLPDTRMHTHVMSILQINLCYLPLPPVRWRGGVTGKAFGLAISRSQVQILLEATLRNNLRQVVYTYVPLSPSSITWYRPVHRDQLWAQRSVSSMGSLYLYLTPSYELEDFVAAKFYCLHAPADGN